MIDNCPQCALSHQNDVFSAEKVAERKSLKLTWINGGMLNDSSETTVITFDGRISPDRRADLMKIIRLIDAENEQPK